MTAAMERRLARLEARKPSVFVPFDDAAAAALLQWHLDNFAAVDAGWACAIPVYGPPREPLPALAAILRDSDRIAARLAAERAKEALPGGA
jgi:hypothetical protein